VSVLTELVGAELLKLRATRSMWAVMIIAFSVMVVPVVLLLVFVAPSDLAGPSTLIDLTIPGVVVGLSVLILGVLGMASEFRHGTITSTFLATPRRLVVIVLKLGVFFVAGAAAAVVALVLIYLTIVVILPFRGVAIPTPHDGEWAYLGRVVLTTGLFGAAGVAIGALLRSQVLAVSLTLGWIVLEQSLAGPLLLFTGHERIASFLPLTVFQQVAGNPLQGSDSTATTVLSPSQALLVGVGYIALVAAAATVTTLRRDVT
jgi:ABC-2 type transport system permease protein